MSEKTIERRRDFDGPVSHDRAREAAQRFIDLAFNNKKGERPQLRIPADPNDDDLVLTSYIAQQRALTSECDEAVRVADDLRAKAIGAMHQARGALRLDAMIDDDGKPFGTTVEALKALDEALDALTQAGDLPLKEQE